MACLSRPNLFRPRPRHRTRWANAYQRERRRGKAAGSPAEGGREEVPDEGGTDDHRTWNERRQRRRRQTVEYRGVDGSGESSGVGGGRNRETRTPKTFNPGEFDSVDGVTLTTISTLEQILQGAVTMKGVISL